MADLSMLDRNIVSGMPPEKSVTSKIRWMGSHVFGPSNIILVVDRPRQPTLLALDTSFWLTEECFVWGCSCLSVFTYMHPQRVGIEWVGWVESGQSLAAEE